MALANGTVPASKIAEATTEVVATPVPVTEPKVLSTNEKKPAVAEPKVLSTNEKKPAAKKKSKAA
jgi:hypothetical protein